MSTYRYMQIPLKYTTLEIMAEYDINSLVSNSYIHIKIHKGMYGLKEAGIIAYTRLVAKLAPHGYHPCTHIPGLWTHHTRSIKFTLAVDDFGIKYFKKEDAEHLLTVLRENYTISTDLTGRNYCGLTIALHYEHGYVDIVMPGYILEALRKFQHQPSKHP